MAYRLEFYRTTRGAEPALDYVRAQVKAHRAKIGRALQYLEELGHSARRPMVDYLEDGLYELRVGAGGHQHRILYFFHRRTLIVVTSAFLKNEDAVPPEELARAKRHRVDWLERFGGAA
jgi:phage-related protein